MEVVKNMVHEYMKNKRSIILAVISAANDYANQVILKRAQKVDKDGRRAVGVITKPDVPPEGSDTQATIINLAMNHEITLNLGWHVLRNRKYEERDISSNERDEKETTFFNIGCWRPLDRDKVGVHSLCERLSRVLFEQISAELPSSISDIEGKTQRCRDTLAKTWTRQEDC